ncbi:MAG: tRNA preQ1(34) S-adenosylmethionine ribosyltransferase-isomerase QueA [Bacteroidales bacterium]|jgi:S-adenosylmethionine:tRNA ribosyltransferase-isomerase|nr:tRNA preQ1(34) S-adenosylmethionine ribosyltransferase-isomerase QueA [Bacteroidales bacterium]
MKLSQFNFFLPPDLIAQYPFEDKDETRMLVVDRNAKTITHHKFKDLLNIFGEGDVMVRNDTRVFPALLNGSKERHATQISVFLLRELDSESRLWDVLVEPARKIRIGNRIYFGDNEEMTAEVIDNTTSRGRTLRFLYDGTHEEFKKKLYDMGSMPLPDDILKLRDPIPEDREYYQTVYAKHEGAVVAPAAGLHFSKLLLKKLEVKGVKLADITLHASVGTFKSIDVEDLAKHKVDSEAMNIPEETADIINAAKTQHKRVCAVGTTTLKALESSVYNSGIIKPLQGWTNKFIFPLYEFYSVDSLITNFHMPQSAMLMMVCAFGGYELVMEAYKQAIAEKYRFLTFGDAMLII